MPKKKKKSPKERHLKPIKLRQKCAKTQMCSSELFLGTLFRRMREAKSQSTKKKNKQKT